jgi:amino acid adenylation domain-containing protein
MESPESPAKMPQSLLEASFEECVELLYWRQQLIPNPPVIELPCDGVRSGTANHEQSYLSMSLTIALRSRLQLWVQQTGLSLENVLLITFQILLHRYTDETDLLIYGTRSSSSTANIHNPLLLRTQVLPTDTGREVYQAAQQAVLEANTHGEISLAELMGQIQPDRDLETQPLTVIEFGIQTAAQPVVQDEQSDRDLVFTVVLGESGILGEQDWQVNLSYRSSLFLPDSLTRLVGHYECLLSGLLEQFDGPIYQLPLLTPGEQQHLGVSGSGAETLYGNSDRCIHDYIEAQVEKTPNAIALVFPDRHGKIHQLTYRELNAKANQLAHYLRSQGIQPDDSEQNFGQTPIVAVCVDRSPEMVIAFLGILKAGAAYLPLDPLYPHERRVYKLKDCETSLLLTQAHLASTVVPDDFAGEVLCLDQDWDHAIARHSTTNPVNLSSPDSLAYLIYTSGSTGNPKGVLIPHKGLVNHCFAMVDAFALQPSDRMLQFSSMSFDIIIEELYPTLVTGATLVLRSEIIASSINEFLTFIDRHQVTLLDLPTAFWHELVRGLGQLDRRLPESVRLVVVGGEKASKSLYQQWCELVPSTVRWLNTYGPTETTVSATLYEPAVEGFTWDQAEIPIGRPLNNVKTYILDRHLNPVPVGIPGELYIGGVGVAQGYLNQPEKTQDKFIPNPFTQKTDDRIYSTGDVVRYRSDGTIEFVGRRDFQVKIRGFRIELGEIEQALETYDDLQQAVVIALESTSGQKSLAAYYTVRSSVQKSDLRSFLQAKLPNYMIPTYFTALSTFPLTTNGKVDRKALPNPQTALLNDDLQAPSDEIETQLLSMWQGLLGITNLCVTDNFFEMGGHSLLMTRMLLEIEAIWDKELPINILFEAPTIRQLAAFLRSEDPNADRQTVVPFRTEGSQPPVFCVPGARGNLLFAHSLVQHWGDRDHPVYGLQEPLITDINPLPSSIPAIASYYIHQIKTVQSEGPYYLVGYSIGGLIAYEMAQQLRSGGQEVALLGLLDPAPPIAAIQERAMIQRFSTSSRWTFALQLGLLKLVELQDQYRLRLQDVSREAVPSYLFHEFKTWLQSSEAQGFWLRFRSIVGLASEPKTNPSGPETPALSLAMVMKYDRAILHYLPKVYGGRVTFFCSEEWGQDPVNWKAWERWYEGGCDRYPLSGSHITFYRQNTAEMVSRLLP